MIDSILKRVTLAFFCTLVVFIITAFSLIRLVELNCYTKLRNSIEEKIEHNKTLAKSMLTSLRQIASVSNQASLDTRAQPVFDTSRELYHMAFIAKADGTLLTHSDPAESARLNGNIASDEFRYNLEEIYYPLAHEIDGLTRRDYHILDMEVPFDSYTLATIKEYVYSGISKNGVLYTEKIRLMDGTICSSSIIFSKTNLYSFIRTNLDELQRLKVSIVLLCLLLSSVIGMMIFIITGNRKREETLRLPDSVIQQGVQEYPAETLREPYRSYEAASSTPQSQPVIQDAIPIRKRGRR